MLSPDGEPEKMMMTSIWGRHDDNWATKHKTSFLPSYVKNTVSFVQTCLKLGLLFRELPTSATRYVSF